MTRVSVPLEIKPEELAQQASLLSVIPVSLVGTDGFDAARIGSVENDIEGRTFHQAANRIGWFAPFLNVTMAKIRESTASTSSSSWRGCPLPLSLMLSGSRSCAKGSPPGSPRTT